MLKKRLRVLAWFVLIALTIFFNDNMLVMAGVATLLVITEWGPGIFIKIALKGKKMLWAKIKDEFKAKTKKEKK